MHRVDLGAETPDLKFPPHFRTTLNTPANWCNAVQEEICHLIEGTGLTLSEESNQMEAAITKAEEIYYSLWTMDIPWRNNNRRQGTEINIPNVTPLNLLGMGYVAFDLTFVFKVGNHIAFDYLTVKQEFVRVADSWLNTSSFGRTSCNYRLPMTALSPGGRLTLYPESLSSTVCLCSSCKAHYFAADLPAWLRSIQITHFIQQPLQEVR